MAYGGLLASSGATPFIVGDQAQARAMRREARGGSPSASLSNSSGQAFGLGARLQPAW